MDDTWNLQAGHLLNGRYSIIRALVQNVYLAEDSTLNRPVLITEYFPRGAYRLETLAVGRLPEDEASYQKGLGDFLQSGMIFAKCIELAPTVPSVLDVFRANATGYIAETYIEGVRLEQIVQEEGSIPAERMVSWLEPAIKSLAEIHRMGFFHRTIALDCFHRSSDGAVWLTSFHRDAIRVWLDSEKEKRAFPDRKTVYAPFEAFTSQGWCASGDVYGLCAVMYDCLTGQRPVHILE